MVEEILELFPIAIHDMNSEGKNIVLVAVENKQSRIYELLLHRNAFNDIIFRQVDERGNSVLHLAATLGGYKPWLISGPALQMQWEIKWYEFVKDSIDPNYTTQLNKEGKTPEDVFTETHKELAEKGSQWLTDTSESCFLVATIITTVTFASSAAVPGSVNETGVPTFEEQPAFFIFAISSLIAFCFSVISVITYLSILTTRHLEKDFAHLLPRKYLLALSSLLISIVSMLVSFCSSHFFVLRDKLKLNAYPLYAFSCLVVTLFVVFQFPLYLDFMTASFSKLSRRHSLKDRAGTL
ncbi:hypothetical protein L1049_016501 [Liquidambar formosana]|uniref:PGG domain-containing protein n=1 Tax=Liquidambar formosana TaxID=63359 RepID=A0AAP0X7K2_LIQFO